MYRKNTAAPLIDQEAKGSRLCVEHNLPDGHCHQLRQRSPAFVVVDLCRESAGPEQSPCGRTETEEGSELRRRGGERSSAARSHPTPKKNTTTKTQSDTAENVLHCQILRHYTDIHKCFGRDQKRAKMQCILPILSNA